MKPDLIADLMALSLVFVAGLLSGVTIAIVVDRPKPRPWWDQD